MDFNKTPLKIYAVVASIILLAFLLAWLWTQETKTFSIIGVVVAMLLLGQLMIYLMGQTNRDITRFFISLEEGDLSAPPKIRFSSGSYQDLYHAFSKVQAKLFKIRAEKEENYQLYQVLLDQSETGLILLDETKNIVLSNPAARRSFNLPSGDQARPFDSSISGGALLLKHLQTRNKLLWRPSNTDGTQELLIQTKEFTLNSKAMTLIHFQNVKNVMDQRVFQNQSQLIRILSHEINNSLTPVATVVDALKDSDEFSRASKENQQAFKIIQDQTTTVLNLVNQYREISKIPEPKMEWICISDYLLQFINLHSAWLQKQEIQFETFITTQELFLQTDPILFGQVMQNLLTNAIEALEQTQNKKLELRVERQELGSLKIILKDNGEGISSDFVPQLFTPFLSSKDQGSGIGLALSLQIMRLLDGTIELKNNSDSGASALVVFNSSKVCQKCEHHNQNPNQSNTS